MKRILSASLGLCALAAILGCASDNGTAYVQEEIRVKNDMAGVPITVGFGKPADPLDPGTVDLAPGKEVTRLVARRADARFVVFVDGFDKANGRAGKKEFTVYPQNPEPKPGSKERHTDFVVGDLNWFRPTGS